MATITRTDRYGHQSFPQREGVGESFTLLELNALVRHAIDASLTREYWVEAELSECRESRGHCYMELVQKDEQQNTPVARASAKCWRNTWMLLQPHFEQATGQPLHAGLKVRMKVYAQFHEVFGFSWIVTDIDPTYTLGDMARRRQDILRQLRQEGVLDLQRELTLPLFCQRIAVISSATAAGYGDFVNHLADAPFAFHTELFPATMQGEQVEQSIIAALNEIYRLSSFDCVVIIRGGGATADLSGFDTLSLAENVAQFPLPIITGIGHDRDESILDMVSHLRVKTPTAAADFLIQHLQQTADRICSAEERLLRTTTQRLVTERLRLSRLAERIPSLSGIVKARQEARLAQLQQRLATAIERQLERNHNRLSMLQQRIRSLDPNLLLQRGYSITLFNGHALRSADELQPGDIIETRLAQGTLHSQVADVARKRKSQQKANRNTP